MFIWGSESIKYGTLRQNIEAESTCLSTPANCTEINCINIDKCNGYKAETVTAAPPATLPFPMANKGVLFGLSLLIVIAIVAAAVVMIIASVVIIICCCCKKRRGEGYEKAEGDEETGEDQAV